MSRMINRLSGRVYGWFESKDARLVSKPMPAKFSNRRAQLALLSLEDRAVPATISGVVYNDIDGNGLQQPTGPGILGEPGLAGVTVFLDESPFSGTIDNTGGTPATFNATGGLPTFIPDTGSATAKYTSTAVVGTAGTIFDLNITINITHTYTGDLTAYLLAPDGVTRVTLVQEEGGGGQNFAGTTFDDEAAVTVVGAAAPFSGSFIPESPLSAFDGKSMTGTWTLEVMDKFNLDGGTVDSWSMEITPAVGEASFVTGPAGTYSFTGVAAGTYNVTILPASVPTGFTLTNPATGISNVTVAAPDIVTKNFAARRPSSTIYGSVYADANANSNVDSGEGQAGVVVYNDANNNGILDGATQTKGTSLPMFIADSPAVTTNNSAPVAGVLGTITDVNVAMNLTHTWDSDLDIFLVSPLGTRIELSTDNGGSGDNYTNTLFDDSAATSIITGAVPFTGSFQPEAALAALVGESPNGVWQLEFTDDEGGDTGNLLSWSVIIQTTSAEVFTTTDAQGGYSFTGLAAADYKLRQVAPAGFTQVDPAANGPVLVTTTAGSGVADKNFRNAQTPIAQANGLYPVVNVDDITTNPYYFEVRYTNTSPINEATLGANLGEDIVTVPATGVVTFDSIVSGLDTGDLVAKYKLVPTGGWTVSDNLPGGYTIRAVAGSVASDNGFSIAETDIAVLNVAFPETIEVTTELDVINAGDGLTSLREALNRANALTPSIDTITFNAAAFATDKTITIDPMLGSFTISDGVILGNTDATKTAGVITISGGGAFRVLSTTAAPANTPITIRNLTLANGSVAGAGGALQIGDEALTLQSVVLTGNTTTAGGGAIYAGAGAALSISKSTLSSNLAGGRGGAIHWVGGTTNNFTISQSTLSDNTTTGTNGGGGAIFASPAKLTIVQSTISGNDHTAAAYGGGGIYAVGGTGTSLIITNSTISGNTSTAVFGTGGGGGGVYTFLVPATFQITNTTISGNSAPFGGGISIAATAGTLVLTNSKITDNLASTTGGGLFSNAAAGTIINIIDSTFSGNSAASGGGIGLTTNKATVTITSSTINGNTASGDGGGIFSNAATGSVINVASSTIAGNLATGNGGGVALLTNAVNPQTLGINNSTIVNNSATIAGGGLYSNAAAGTIVNIESSVVAGNSANALAEDFNIVDPLNTTVNATYSAWSSLYTPNGTDTSNLSNAPLAAMQLGALGNNGGPTQTVAIGATSSLKDTANPVQVATLDQRGLARVVGPAADIGAFEIQSVAIPAVTGFVINDGTAQRSRITSITVTFAGPVTVGQFAAVGAIRLTRPEVAPPAIAIILQTGETDANEGLITVSQTVPGSNTLVLTFSNVGGLNNPGFPTEFGSLSDGRYRLEIPSAGAGFVSDPNLDTDPGVPVVFGQQIRRIFGDINGDGTVEGSTDFGQFGNVFGTSVPLGNPFDFNQDGDINGGTDFAQFGNRFGVTV